MFCFFSIKDPLKMWFSNPLDCRLCFCVVFM